MAQWFWRRSLKCEKFTDDGCQVMAIVPMDLWSRWTKKGLRVRVIVFNATFNNISVIWWQSVLLVEETRVPGERHRLATSQYWAGFKLTTLVTIGTDCIDSCKSNYHTITATRAPYRKGLHYIHFVVIYIV